MWPLGRTPTKADLEGHKALRVGGRRFVIRKINPLLDFPSDRMPQIFASFISRRPQESKRLPDAAEKRLEEDVKMIVAAGVVEPRLTPAEKAKPEDLTVNDLFRDPAMGTQLYIEVLTHSLNRFSGLRGVFFSIKTKLLLSMHSRRAMDASRLTFFSQMEPTA